MPDDAVATAAQTADTAADPMPDWAGIRAGISVALQGSPTLVATLTPELRVTWVSDSTGIPPEQIIGMSVVDLFPGDTGTAFAAVMRSVLETGVPYRDEVPVSWFGQDLVWAVNVAPVSDRDGPPRLLAVAITNVTDVRRIERDLREANASLELRVVERTQELLASQDALIESQQALRSSLDAVIEGYAIYRATADADGKYLDARIIYANETWVSQFSPGEPDVVGRSLYSFPGASRRFGMHAQVYETGQPFRGEVDIETREGRRILDLQMVRFGDNIVGSSRDITEQRRAERALRASERRYRELIDGLDAIVWDEEIETGKLFVNAQGERLMGYTQKQWENPRLWQEVIVPEDRERVVATLNGDEDADIEYRMVRADGIVRWFRDRMRVVKDDHGRPLRRYGITIDVTERRELEARVSQTERMGVMGQLVASAAHDFDNVLYGISIFANGLLKAHPDETDQDHRDAKAIVHAVESAQQLTKSMLAFAREQPLASTRVIVDDAVRRVETMIESVVGSRVRLQIQLAAPEPVMGDMSAIEQVLLNLAINARDAMPDGGVFRVTTRMVELDADVAAALDVEPGRGVLIAVEDTGIGMDEETASLAFVPYFTTKPVGQGTGLGLATVWGTVKAARGGVAISSEPGIGTTIRMFLPVAPPEE